MVSTAKNANMVRTGLMAVWGLATLVLLFSLVLLGYEFYRRGDRGATAMPDTPIFAPSHPSYSGANEREIDLYFAAPDSLKLWPEARLIELTNDTVENCKRAFGELLMGPQSEAVPVLPASSALRAIYLLDSGELVVDFTRGVDAPEIASVSGELMFLRGVVATLAQPGLHAGNSRRVQRVRILFEGAPTSDRFPKHIVIGGAIAPESAWLATNNLGAGNV